MSRKINYLNVIGQKFGKLTIIEHKPNNSVVYHPNLYYVCKCDCGNTRYVRLDYLTYGKVTACKDCAKKSKKQKCTMPHKKNISNIPIDQYQKLSMAERLKIDTGIELEVDILLLCLTLYPAIQDLIHPACGMDNRHQLIMQQIRYHLYDYKYSG